MNINQIREEYDRAYRLGLREVKECRAAGLEPFPAVLDELLPDLGQHSVQDLPVRDIPAERITGTRTAGRISAFSKSFYPLIDPESEFCSKWMNLCEAHLSDTGIREPILCYEYLGNFYVEEGNKRVSVLRYFGAARIPAVVKRVMPRQSEEPRIKAYFEFLDFYKHSGLYDIQFRRPGDYARLCLHLDKEPDEDWTEFERRKFSSAYHYFLKAFYEVAGKNIAIQPEEALLLWLKVYPISALSDFSSKELKKSISGLWDDVRAEAEPGKVQLRTTPDTGSKGILSRWLDPAPASIKAAFIHQRDCLTSPWTRAHATGAHIMEDALAPQVSIKNYYFADSADEAEELITVAIEDGANLVFTTTPQLRRATLKAAVKYPNVRFMNCSADSPLSSVRSYYCRVYEGKFITGMIAGALAKGSPIGYVASYPIMGVPASINAFALGAQLTNPNAEILLEWSCLPGDSTRALLERGVRIISNRDVPMKGKGYLDHDGRYGTYMVQEDGSMLSLASPCWEWGKLYENVARSILSGHWEKKSGEAVNYWLGMDTGVIGMELSDRLPEGIRTLADILIRDMCDGRLDPFRRVIRGQDGSLKNDGTHGFTPAEVLHMDWLCGNVTGRIPAFDELLAVSRPLVRELGVYKDSIPPEKEGSF